MDWSWILLLVARAVGTAPDERWATTLDRLDGVRAEAFATGDPSMLDRVYAPGSRSREVDSNLIASYADRGGRVKGADLVVVSCRTIVESDTAARLAVVDRLAPSHVEWSDGSRVDLPRDQPTRRTISLVHTADGWRIAD